MCCRYCRKFYIADQVNNVIRKVDANGIITTVSATATPAFQVTAVTQRKATLNPPTGLAMDRRRLFFTDRNNLRVRKVSTRHHHDSCR